jgi:hypothetical protein
MESLVMLFTIIFTIVDDYLIAMFNASSYQRTRGREPIFTDSEVITVSLVMELLDKPQEDSFLVYLKSHLSSLFPRLLSQSRFNRRRRNLTAVTNSVRFKVMKKVMPLCAGFGLLDTLPVKVVGYKRSKKRSPFLGVANYGYCASKEEKYFGFKLILLVTPEGLPINFALVPANLADCDTPWEVLDTIQNLTVLADKGMINQKQQLELKALRNIDLITPKRKNQKGFNPRTNRLLSGIRQMVETVGSQLNSVVNLNRHYAKTVDGFITRMTAKLTAFTFGFFVNVQQGFNPLAIRNLAYQLA